MSHQDWSTKVYSSKAVLPGKPQNQVLDDGVQAITKPKGSGALSGQNLHKVLNSESMAVPVASHEFKAALLQARNAKEMKQDDLARELCVKATVVSRWESGKEVPDNATIAKIERILGTKLPRPPKLKL